MQNNRIKKRWPWSNTGSGGGLYLVHSHLYLNGSVRVANKEAVKNGGGMCILSGSFSSTNLSSLVITENNAETSFSAGGGLFLRDASVNLAGYMILASNGAGFDGGGISV